MQPVAVASPHRASVRRDAGTDGDVGLPARGVWPPRRVGVLGPRHRPSTDALAGLPSVEVLVFVANIAHGLAGGAAYFLRPEAA